MFCKFCKRNDFKNEHGLKIHIAKAHQQDMERQRGSAHPRGRQASTTKRFDERKSSERPSSTHEYKTKPNPQSMTPGGQGVQRRHHTSDEIRRHAANIVQTDALLKGAHPGNNHKYLGEQKMKTTNGAGARPKETPKKSHSPKVGHRPQTQKKTDTADRDQARSSEVLSCPVCQKQYKHQGWLDLHMEMKHLTHPSSERGKNNHGSREEKKSQENDRPSSRASNFAESFNIKTFEKWVNVAEASIVRQKTDTDSTIQRMNRFIDNLQSTIDGISKFPLKTLKSGSYYDRTKIDYDDEFDFMFYPDVKLEAVFTKCPPGYCKIRKGATVNKDLEPYLDSKGFLVPEKFKKAMFDIFETALKDPSFREGRRTKRQTRKPESPAFTVLFDLGIYDKSPIDVDLVPAIKIESWPETARDIRPDWVKEKTAEKAKRCFHAVMKTYPENWQDKDLLWRVSFANAEKELILHANEKEKGCRKDIFKVLKKIKEVMKTRKPQIDKLCSYHLKMFMLRFYEENDDFRNENVRKLSLLKQAINELARMVKRGEVPNYFIPKDNVIMFVPEEERQIIYNELLDLLEGQWT